MVMMIDNDDSHFHDNHHHNDKWINAGDKIPMAIEKTGPLPVILKVCCSQKMSSEASS